ncbi:Diguanylate cyclase (GGDEF) [Modestobacter italicus]|uniref:Diguanylate cyclase (GGDEF) n=1 Tax=Modestobacter italicus (strain DSM 44449 / CECT 9708 / BC 501) TaxID=2732864 RepID=I4EVB8_MODI5|nr:GGDEF domain-containing protein [Modestobacter marinus]CCH87331.1 Diguanylate cyclase (GGDEF) [Modestobacter marinus]
MRRDGAPELPDVGSENRLAAFCLAGLLGVGAVLGLLNLVIDGAVRAGPTRPVYVAAMVLLLTLGLVVLVRRRVTAAATAAIVVTGDLVYVVLAESVTDPLRYASPLMLLLCCVAAAWFLGPRMLALHMVLVVGACGAALSRSFPDTAGLVLQVTVAAAVLDLMTLVVFLLRRRVQRLLVHTVALSSTDPLTGLANRRSLVESAPRIWKQARRDGQRVAALVLDLDHFKRLNDAFGHAAGDDVLRCVSAALSATVRPADVLARTGGEELVVLGLVADHSEARHLAERLRSAVAASGSEEHRRVTVSIGVALTRPGDGEDPADGLWRLIDRADAAMYQAKQDGRDQVALATAAVVPAPRVPGEPAPRAASGRP